MREENSLKEIQKKVQEWILNHGGYWSPLAMLSAVTEEVGELAREINHRFGPKKKKSTEKVKEVGDEISDILFNLICLANSLDIDLDEAFKRKMDKQFKRDDNRFERK